MKTYGLIGYPLGHSFSQDFFNRKFAAENIRDCCYKLFPLPDLSLFPSLLSGEPTLAGLNVTIPHKRKIIPFLDRLDEEAAITGAVNTIKIDHHGLTGYNTDITGFENSFLPLLKPHHAGALVLGTGGSAAAAAYVLEKHRIPFMYVSRNPESGSGIPYSAIDKDLLESYPVIINCTPAGMFPNLHEAPDIPYGLLGPGNYLFDMVYNPDPTVFLEKGALAGAAVKSGAEMLRIQAEAAWAVWNQ